MGADDGNLQRSRDGGKTWDNLTGNLPGVPDQTYVTRLIASAHSASRVYATLDGHRNDDYSTYVFRSDDYGDSFDSLGGTLPPEAALNVIREHHDNEDFLVTGGEFGVYVTLDRGANWHRIGGQIPTVPVDDLAIHPRENDLILGTHGRSVWIADDIAPLTTLDASVFEKDVHLFPVRDAVAWRIYTHKGNTGHKFFIAPNPPEGALLHVYAKAEGDAEITVSAAGGDAVRTLKAELEPGLNRVNWDLRYDSPVPDGGQGFGGPPQGPRVLPGSYTVRVASGDAAAEGSVQVSEDPRIQIPDADRRANHDALVRLTSMVAGMTRAHEAAEATAEEAADLVQAFVSEPDSDLKTRVGEFREAAAEAARNLSRNEGRQGRGAWPRPLFARIGAEARGLDAYTEAPNAEVLARIDAMSSEYDERIAAWEAVRGQIDSLNEALRGAGPPRLTPRPGGAD